MSAITRLQILLFLEHFAHYERRKISFANDQDNRKDVRARVAINETHLQHLRTAVCNK